MILCNRADADDWQRRELDRNVRYEDTAVPISGLPRGPSGIVFARGLRHDRAPSTGRRRLVIWQHHTGARNFAIASRAMVTDAMSSFDAHHSV